MLPCKIALMRASGPSDTFFAQASQRGAIGSNSLDSMTGVILAI